MLYFLLFTCRYSVKKNLVVDEVDVLQEELVHYKKAGGGTLVDVTTHGIRLDPSPLPRLAQESGVNIVCGTGFYVDATLEDEIKVTFLEKVGFICVVVCVCNWTSLVCIPEPL